MGAGEYLDVIKNRTSRIDALWARVNPRTNGGLDLLRSPNPPVARSTPTCSRLLHVSPHVDRPKWVSLAGNVDVDVAGGTGTSHAGGAGISFGNDVPNTSDALADDILERARGERAAIVVQSHTPQRGRSSSRRLSGLEPLKPIEMARIPEPPVFVEKKLDVPAAIAPKATVVVPTAKQPVVPTAKAATSMPPVPSFDMLNKSKVMMAAVTGPKPVPPAVAPPKAPAASGPPIPSLDMLKKSQNLMAATVPEAKPKVFGGEQSADPVLRHAQEVPEPHGRRGTGGTQAAGTGTDRSRSAFALALALALALAPAFKDRGVFFRR